MSTLQLGVDMEPAAQRRYLVVMTRLWESIVAQAFNEF